MDFQKLFDAMSDESRRDRSKYHLTLGGLISFLEGVDASFPVKDSLGRSVGGMDSYRGYYADLAVGFDPQTAGELLETAKDAIGTTFQGYKGGDFLMNSDAPLWVAAYGYCGPAVIDAAVVDGTVVLTTKDLE